jgi:geranylgeranyl pyrophosphate synthase
VAGDAERRALRRFAERLGLAFQTLDDLLDNPAEAQADGSGHKNSYTGKDTGKDTGKPTLIDLLGEARARRQVEEWIEEACESLNALPGGAEPLSGFVRATLSATLRQ